MFLYIMLYGFNLDTPVYKFIILINTLCILFQVTETTCQLYVACESAHTHLHEKHGKLAKIVHEVGSDVIW